MDGTGADRTPEGDFIREGLLEARIERNGDTNVLALRGELDMSNAASVESALERLEASEAPHLLLDLSRLEFCDSTGLAVILRAVTRSRDIDLHRLRLVKGPPKVQRVFKLTGLEQQLPFVDEG